MTSIHICGVKVGINVTTITLRAEASTVHVITRVTAKTCRTLFNFANKGCSMAIQTTHFFVSAINLKLGASIMIEIPNFPIPRIVAILAERAKLFFMHIVFLMARKAVRLSLFKFASQMTFLALHWPVLAQQWELGLVMIKVFYFPRSLGMTIFTLLTFSAFMHIIALMAVETSAIRL